MRTLRAENRVVMQKNKTEYTRYLNLEESYWQQKVVYDWFVDGDRNTKFFHSMVKGRRQKLKLMKIQNQQRVWLEKSKEITDKAVMFY